MHVYTYYGPTAFDHNEQQSLIGLWRESWAKQGFEPVVLDHKDMLRCDRSAELLKKATDLPTINIKQYEVNCFIRYAAVQAKGGGIMTDYDVMNYWIHPGRLLWHEYRYP